MIRKTILSFIKFYQIIMSPFLGEHCRFYPSCSEYSFKAIEKYGILKGIILSFWRVMRCNPLNRGGIDMP